MRTAAKSQVRALVRAFFFNVDLVSSGINHTIDQRTEDESLGGLSDNGGEESERQGLETSGRQKTSARYFGGKSKAGNTTQASHRYSSLSVMRTVDESCAG